MPVEDDVLARLDRSLVQVCVRGQFVLSCVVVLVFVLLGLTAPVLAGEQPVRKRDYDVPRQTVEAGLYLLTQKSFYGDTQRGLSLPVSWTRFASDSLDWRFEGWLSYVATHGDGWFSATMGPGFRYWVGTDTAVSPFVRLGFATDPAAARSFVIHGADVLIERGFPLARGARHEDHRFWMLEAQIGYLAHRVVDGSRGSFGHRFIKGGISYDWPFFPESWDAENRKRAKLTVGVEKQFGSGKNYSHLIYTTISLREESVGTGKMVRKLEFSIGGNASGLRRFSAGVAQGF